MRKILLIYFVLMVVFLGDAQNNTADSLFKVAKQIAQSGDLDEAINRMNVLMVDNPKNADYSIYTARLFFWKNEFKKSLELIEMSWDPFTKDSEVQILYIRVQTALQDHIKAIEQAEIAKDSFPHLAHDFLLLQAIALEASNRDDEALDKLALISKEAPNRNDADYLKTLILKKKKNLISASYLLVFFHPSSFNVQHQASIEYMRKFKGFSQIFRVNYANMFESNAYQFETDSYVRFKRKDYIYMNAGIAHNQSLFPRLRLGGEYFKEFKYISSSIGARYLHFSVTNNPLLITGHISYTSKEITFNYRPFILLMGNQELISHVGYIRKSRQSKESYLQVDLQYGTLPYFIYTMDIITRLNAVRIGTSAKFRIKDSYFLQPAIMYEFEEYIPDYFRNRIMLHLTVSKRF